MPTLFDPVLPFLLLFELHALHAVEVQGLRIIFGAYEPDAAVVVPLQTDLAAYHIYLVSKVPPANAVDVAF